jgi:hypothetical protein
VLVLAGCGGGGGLRATTPTQPPRTTTSAVVASIDGADASVPSATGGDPPASGADGPRFVTLPPGSTLPGDEDCRARVRPAPEIRPENATFNQTTGHPTQPELPYFALAGRITGNFTGTTDEIIQWVACKWGIDEDVVRAQVARESWWYQSAVGDYSDDPTLCAPGHPIGADDETDKCPESIGLGQVRAQYYRSYIEAAAGSSAYNLDVTYGIWRACFEGAETWLNEVERGTDYAAGDLWGCVGRWFSGRWYTKPANDYIAGVREYYENRVWWNPNFISG